MAHSALYYYNEAVNSQQWGKAASYLISVYSSGVKPYASGAGEDIQNQKLVPTIVVYTLDPQVAGIYQFLVKLGFLQPDPQVDALINSGKIVPNSSAIPAVTFASVQANQIATKEIQSLSPAGGAATTSGPMMLLLLAGGALLLFKKKKKKDARK